MDKEKMIYDWFNKHGIEYLSKGILKKVNSRITERIVTTIGADSDNDHIPSALAVYRAIASQAHMSIRLVIGNIDEQVPVEERSATVIYWQKDTEEDTTWNIYLWDADNNQWLYIDNSELDLSGYWKKTDTEAIREDLGIPAIEQNVSSLQDAVAGINERLDGVDDTIAQIQTDVADNAIAIDDLDDRKVNRSDLVAITNPEIKDILDRAYNATDPFKFVPAASSAEIESVMDAAIAAGETEVAVKVSEDIDLTESEIKTITVPAGVTLEVNIDEAEILCTDNAFNVSNGGTLKLVGDGTIVATTKAARGAITVNGGGTLIIDGITIDGTTQGTEENYVYGVYAKNHSRIEFKSGVINVAGASCISTNNTTGGSDIVVTGGELYSDGCYAIYNPAQGTVSVSNATVQGIHARMGTINLGPGAKIIPPTINAENAVDIGANINTSGSVELGDAVVLIAGSYSDPNGIDIELNVDADATIESNFRSAIGVYMLDTKAAANVDITVANGKNVVTADPGFDAIKVYDHDYIIAAATAAGKAYNPVATSNVTVTVDGVTV